MISTVSAIVAFVVGSIPTFKQLMKFIMLAYTSTVVIFFLFPTCQELRPVVFERCNVFTSLVDFFYRIDTNTNVCPSLHAAGSIAVWFAARETLLFQHQGWRFFFHIATVAICLSVVFLKQHSILDVLAGFLVSGIAYEIMYRPKS